MRIERVSFIISLFLTLFFLFGCGRKAPPLPIEKSLPQEAEFSLEPTPYGINLWLTLPEKTQGGFPLTKIQFVEIERKEEPLFGEGKREFKRFKIKPKLHSAGRLLLFTDSHLKPERKYTYRIRIKKDFLVGTPFYGEKSIYWTEPPALVRDFIFYLSSPEELLLKWNPPLENIKGGPLAGELLYNIEKIKEGEIEYLTVRDPFFKEKISQEKRVCFRVRALLNYHGTFLPGPFTQPICYP